MKSGPLAASCLLLGSFATSVECPIHHYGFNGFASSSCAAIITITIRLLCYHHHHHHENNLLLPFACASCLSLTCVFAVSGVVQSDSKVNVSVHSTDAWWISAGIFEWRSPAFLEYMDIHRLENDVVVQACSIDTNLFYSLVEPFHLQAHADESGSDSD